MSIERLKRRGLFVQVEHKPAAAGCEPIGSELADREFWAHSLNKSLANRESFQDLVLEMNHSISYGASLLGKLGLWACLLGLCYTGNFAADWYHLKHHAVQVTGQVTELDIHESDDSTSYSIDWTYQYNQTDHLGHERITKRTFRQNKIGNDVALLVDQERPSHSVLAAESGLYSYAPSVPMNIFGILLFGVFVWAIRRQEKKERLLREQGMMVAGEILDSRIEEDDDGPDKLVLKLRLQTEAGAIESERCLGEVPKPLPSPGTKIQALYLTPQNFGLL